MTKIEDENTFYVPISGAVELRRNMLGAIKKSLTMLKRYEKFRLLREEKVKRVHELRVLIKELDFLNKKLQNTLPKTHLRGNRSREVDIPRIQTAIAAPKRAVTELDKLEYELQSIESKLRGLE